MKSTTLTGMLIAGLALTAGHFVPDVLGRNNPDLQVTSGMFQYGDTLPSAVTCDGGGIMPVLTWTGAPDATKSFAVEVRDLDAASGKFAHWIVTGIAKNLNAIGSVPDGAAAGMNSKGTSGWEPPCPPMGQTHRYAFTVFALDKNIVNPDFTLDKLHSAIDGHVLASGQIVGEYTRLGGMPNAPMDHHMDP